MKEKGQGRETKQNCNVTLDNRKTAAIENSCPKTVGAVLIMVYTELVKTNKPQ